MTSRDSGALRRGILLYLPYRPYFPLHGRSYPILEYTWAAPGPSCGEPYEFGTKRSVSRRPITVAVFRRAVRHHRAPPSQSARSSTPTRCPTVAESASAEKRRMVHAVLCGHVRASFGVPAASMSVNGLDCHRKPQDRRTECPGPPV